MVYKHGVYGEQIPFTGTLSTKTLGTIPVYIGTAPIQQINTLGSPDFDYSELINTPILISSLADAKAKIGYSDSWDKYTLGEVIKAHFDNGVSSIGPIVVVNMASPDLKEATDTTQSITLSGVSGNKVGYIKDCLASIEDVAITAETELAEGDYKLEYDGEWIKVVITKQGFTEATAEAIYKRIDVSDTALTVSVFEKALSAIDLSESLLGVIPNIIVAPGYSEKPAYHEKMISKALSKISQKWFAICVSDISSDIDGNSVSKAISLKTTNDYTSKLDKVCWPMIKYGGYLYHLSTIAALTMQQQDTIADGVPYISPSNKSINATSTVLKDGKAITFDELTANSLNKVGITTVNMVRGSLRLWGSHMANYNHGTIDDILPEDRSDSSVRMMHYLLNTLQYDYLDSIDKPLSRRDIDSIKASIQQWLNGLVNEGKLLYGTINFVEVSNSTEDMVNGDFTFDVATTTTPIAKALTFRVQYSTEGLAALTGGEE
ncbi:hypothetical protein EHE19_001580 [Ruminiclostridium herbifermentans]|uniref:Phage tail sheath protein n=1 Tax=Ruminiclostridium herbifermentans TaxID=2488810 RepID=A0A4U7J714_9FIRM|nr:hypothetical protein [Ruminiclostridium herbifermentans]QNU67262.1 hypothetical protein EHE19_001580 [Ruminiclostridium herbifermentans]